MIKSKLISLLKTFSKQEFRCLGDFVKSPYFNKEKVLIELYNILKKHYPDFSPEGFTREIIYESLFPGKKFNDAILRNTFSKFLKLAGKFLSVHNFDKSEYHSRLFLLEELKARKQEGLFVKYWSEAESLLEEDPIKNEDYFLKKYTLENLYNEFRKITKNYMVFTDKDEADSYEYLLNSFLTSILKVNATIINSNKNFFGENHSFILLDEVENYLKKNPRRLSSNVYLKYYYCSIKLFQTDEDKYFFELRDLISRNLDSFSISDKKNILTTLTNYCYYRINKGELKFVEEQFSLYKLNIEKKIYKGDRDFLSHILFMNVVTTGLDAGESEWVEDFIQRYCDELKNEHKNNMFNFSFALLQLRKRNYDRAIEFASRIVSDDLSYKHQLKSFYLKVYYELGEVQPFYSHVDSYKHFVKNDKLLSGDSREYIMNYISLSKKLFDLKNSPVQDKIEIQILTREIVQHKFLINKFWLLNKVKEL